MADEPVYTTKEIVQRIDRKLDVMQTMVESHLRDSSHILVMMHEERLNDYSKRIKAMEKDQAASQWPRMLGKTALGALIVAMITAIVALFLSGRVPAPPGGWL